MKNVVPVLFTFFYFSAFYFSAFGASYRPPLTNAGTVYQSDVLVIGKAVGEPTVEQWLFAEISDNGEDSFIPRQMAIREFLVQEVLHGQSVEPNSIIRINYVAAESGEETHYSSGNGEQVLLALQIDREAHRMGYGGFINTNPNMITTEGKLESTKAWVEKVRTAKSETINQIIKDEWQEMGYSYPSGDNAGHNNGEEGDHAAYDSESYQRSDDETFTVNYEEAEVYDYEVNGDPQYLRSPEDESVLSDDDTRILENKAAQTQKQLATQAPTAKSNDINSKEVAITEMQQTQAQRSTPSPLLLLGLIGCACLILVVWKRWKKS